MKIGLCIESSTRAKAPALAAALENAGLDYISIGMTGADNESELNYVQTGFLSALVLNLGIVDFVVGGCSTGQGYLNAVLQFPGTSAGLVLDSVDAFLFTGQRRECHLSGFKQGLWNFRCRIESGVHFREAVLRALGRWLSETPR